MLEHGSDQRAEAVVVVDEENRASGCRGRFHIGSLPSALAVLSVWTLTGRSFAQLADVGRTPEPAVRESPCGNPREKDQAKTPVRRGTASGMTRAASSPPASRPSRSSPQPGIS